MTITTTPERAVRILKRAFYLAWKASAEPTKFLPMLHDKPEATEEDVWHNVIGAGDYPCDPTSWQKERHGIIHGDYVFGRMMKLVLHVPELGTIEEAGYDPRPDYQSWCSVYPTYEALLTAAEADVDREDARAHAER